MTQPPSYRRRRKLRVRVIAAVLVVCLAGPPVYFAVQAAAGFGAAFIVLFVISATVILYLAAGRES